MTGKRYLLVTLALCAAVLGPAVALNVVLGNRSLGDPATTRTASEWQEATHGVTYAPPILYNRPFKTLRLHDRLPGINAVVFGASSAFGITESMFPEGIRVYNFSQSGNALPAYLGEAQYVRAHFASRIKWFVIPFDWSIGFLFDATPPAAVDLDPGTVLAAPQAADAPFHRKLLDALSYPKIANLGDILLATLRAPARWQAFQQVFLGRSSEVYACPDGAQAKDFDVLYRGKCGGFRYDGSSTFGAWKRIRADEVRPRLLIAAGPSSKYSQALAATGGDPNRSFLEATARFDKELRDSGGRVIVVLPPLIPGLEEQLSRASHSAASLKRVKQTLSEWSAREQIVVLDAGRSERFGCQPLEFLDEHHAMRECYQKVFDRFWSDYRRGAVGAWYPAEEGGGPR